MNDTTFIERIAPEAITFLQRHDFHIVETPFVRSLFIGVVLESSDFCIVFEEERGLLLIMIGPVNNTFISWQYDKLYAPRTGNFKPWNVPVCCALEFVDPALKFPITRLGMPASPSMIFEELERNYNRIVDVFRSEERCKELLRFSRAQESEIYPGFIKMLPPIEETWS